MDKSEERFTRRWFVDAALIFIGVVVTVLVAVVQLRAVNEGLSSSAAAAVYQQQQQDIDMMFVEDTGLQDYFWFGETFPAEEYGSEAWKKTEAASYRILDHFEHVRYQLDNKLFDGSVEDWGDYISGSFKASQILCESLAENTRQYGGTDQDSLWGRYAAEPCSGHGTTLPPYDRPPAG